MKKTLCLLLAAVMLLSLGGCRLVDNIREVINGVAAHEEGVTDAPVTEKPGTEEPAGPTGVPAAPTEDAHTPTEADAEFEAIDLEFFRSAVTADALSYNAAVSGDPGRFGIDPAEVESGWGEFSLEAHMASMADCRQMQAELAEIDRDALSERNRIGYDALMRNLEVTLMYEDYYYYDEPLTPLNGLHTMLPINLMLFKVRTADDLEAYLLLVEDLERYIGSVAEFEKEKAAEGLFMCETALDQVVESCRGYAEAGGESAFITCFDRVAEQAANAGVGSAQIAAASERNRTAVLEHVLPAYSALADTLESLRPYCTPFEGAAKRGDKAKAYFDLAARDEGATMEPMNVVENKLERMGHNTYMSMYNAIVFGPEDIYDRYGEPITFGSVDNNLEWLRSFAEQYYPALPEYELDKVSVPDDIADDFSPAAYLEPPYDDYRHNTMMINPADEGSEDLLTIAHEALPGHMLQFLITRNTPGMPLSQQTLEPTGYAEGWTVFTESFVAANCGEIGSEYCTMMNSESTFCNVFMPAYVSIKVNYDGWDMAQVTELLTEYGLEDAADIFYEYAVTMPFYAMSYAIGYAYMAEIYESASPQTPEQHRAFFEKYLSFGPNYMDQMAEYMGK